MNLTETDIAWIKQKLVNDFHKLPEWDSQLKAVLVARAKRFGFPELAEDIDKEIV